MLPASARLPQVVPIVAAKGYFILHAPRQTGKTTTMLALARELTAGDAYVAALLRWRSARPLMTILARPKTPSSTTGEPPPGGNYRRPCTRPPGRLATPAGGSVRR
jgi:hypothetical protein